MVPSAIGAFGVRSCMCFKGGAMSRPRMIRSYSTGRVGLWNLRLDPHHRSSHSPAFRHGRSSAAIARRGVLEWFCGDGQ
jgi:hypothetical protein